MVEPERGPALARRWRLLLLCSGLNLLEAALVVAFLPGPDVSLAPQASALGPFGVFHDLRWLSVFGSSWWAALLEVTGAVALRGVIIAAAVRWAWAAGGPSSCPAPWLLWARATLASAVTALLVAPSVAVLFASAVVPVSWLFIAAVPAAVFVAAIVNPIAVRPRWWRRAIPLRSIAWILLTFVVDTADGVAASASGDTASQASAGPVTAVLAVAALTGLFNAWAWGATVRSLAAPPAARERTLPVVPAATALLIAGITAGTLAGFSDARRAAALARHRTDHAMQGPGPAVVVLDGYGSSWVGDQEHPVPGPWRETRFSYAGTGASGQPLAYASADTVKPLVTLVRMLASQVERAAASSGGPVYLVAESEGALVAESYLHATPGAPVRMLLLVSPLLSTSGVPYPSPGDDGWGAAGYFGMSAVGDVFASSSPIDLSPGNAFLRSVVSAGPLVRGLTQCPLKGVRQAALLSLADAVGVPPHLRPAFPTVVLARFHGGMLENPSVDRLVDRLLSGAPVRTDEVMGALESTVSWAASPWQVPTLPVSYFDPGSRPTGAGCAGVDAALARAVWHGGRS